MQSSVGHLQAHVAVTVYVADMVVLRVEDNRVGLPDGSALHHGNGLRNMRVRAQKLGGTFTIAPREPVGTRLEWSIPLQ